MGVALRCIALCLAIAVPVVSAESTFPVRTHVEATGIRWSGTFDGTIGLASIFLTGPGEGNELSLDVHDARFVVLRQPNGSILVDRVLNASEIADPTGTSADKNETRFTGTVRIAPHGMATIVFLPTDRLDLTSNTANEDLEANFQPASDYAFGRVFEHRLYVPDVPGVVSAGAATVQGSACVMVYSATVDATGTQSRHVETGSRTIARQEWSFGQAEASEVVYLMLCASEFTGTFTGAGWNFAWQDVNGVLDGRLWFSSVRSYAGTPTLDTTPALLETHGRFELGATDGRFWGVEGNADLLAADTFVVVGSRAFPAVEAAVVAVGTLAAIVALWRGLPALAVAIGYSRTEPLSSPTRTQILQIVRLESGISASELGRRIGVRRPSVMFHARILARAGLVKLHRSSRRWHVLPPGQAPEQTALEITRRHPIRQDILARLLPGISLPASNLQADGVSLPLVMYHLDALQKQGLVRLSVKDGRKLYARSGMAAAHAPATAHEAVSAGAA